ncbi:MAG: putative quinol monooxygenase [Hyphomonadaceae bacterium]
MIGVVARLPVKPGEEENFKSAMRTLMQGVRDNEPGNKVYTCFQSRANPAEFVVLEIYDDQAALDAHGKSDHFRAAGPALGASLAGRPDIQYLDSF